MLSLLCPCFRSGYQEIVDQEPLLVEVSSKRRIDREPTPFFYGSIATSLEEPVGVLLEKTHKVERVLFQNRTSEILSVKNSEGESFVLKRASDRLQDARILKESKILQFLNGKTGKDSSYVIKQMDTGFFQGTRAIVLEIQELDLHEYVCKMSSERDFRFLSLYEIRRIAKQILQGLCFLRNNNVVHGDIKLDNILLKNGAIKIADFGSAFFEGQDEPTFQPLNYIAPESILETKPYTCALDIWSFSCLFFEMITLERCFAASRFASLILQHEVRLCQSYSEELVARASNLGRTLFRLSRPLSREGICSIESGIEENFKKRGEPASCVNLVTKLIKKMFVIDPEKRLAPADLLKETFFGV